MAALTALVAAPAAAQAEPASTTGGAVTLLSAILAVGLAAAAAWIVTLRRREAALRRDVQALKLGFDALPAPRLISWPNGTPAVANAAWRSRLGEASPADGLAGRLAGGAESAAVLSRLAEAARRGEHADAALGLAGPEGRTRLHRVAVDPVAGQPGLVLWRVDEIERRRAWKRFALDSDGRFERFVDDAGIGHFAFDGTGRLRSVNATFAAWLGTSRAELLVNGASVSSILAERPACGGPRGTVFADGREEGDGEVAFAARDGRVVRLRATQFVFTDGDGSRLTRCLLRNPEAEQPARAEDRDEARLDLFYRDAPFGIVLVDRDRRISDCNPAFAEMAGGDAPSATGSPLSALVSESDRAAFDEWIGEALGDGPLPGPIEVRLGAEAKTVVAIFVARRREAREPQPGLVLHLLNRTEQKGLEEQIFQSQKMELVGQLAGGIAHDFNNLLTAMIGFCDLLLQRHSPKDQSFADINQIKQNANRAANLVRQLLAFSRQQTLQPKILSLTDVVTELSHLLRRLIGASIELKMHHGRDLGMVKADQGQLEQVVINLAVNGRDAMPEGGVLEVRTYNLDAGDPRIAARTDLPDADYVVLQVSDTGCGIAKEHLDKIFEPFFTTKEVGSGTGLGLSTVYGIVKQTGGYIYVDSEQGEGASFTIYLPRYIGDAIRSAAPAAKAEGARRRDLTGIGTILLVEDEDAVRLFGARALRNKGYDVIEANSGDAALKILEDPKVSIDMLISDVVMPGLDGPGLIRQVRESHPDLKVIFISGYTEDSFRKRIDQGQVIHFLPKPFSLQQLAGKVKEVMHG